MIPLYRIRRVVFVGWLLLLLAVTTGFLTRAAAATGRGDHHHHHKPTGGPPGGGGGGAAGVLAASWNTHSVLRVQIHQCHHHASPRNTSTTTSSSCSTETLRSTTPSTTSPISSSITSTSSHFSLTVHDIEDSSSPPQLLHQQPLNFPPPPGSTNNYNETSSFSPPLTVTILIPLLEQQHDDDDNNNHTATIPLLVVPDRTSSSNKNNNRTLQSHTSRILIVALWKNDSILVTRRLATLPKERRKQRQTTTTTTTMDHLLPTVAHVDLIYSYYDECTVATTTTSLGDSATPSTTTTAASHNPATGSTKNDWISWWQVVCGYIMVGIYEYWSRRKPRMPPRDHRRVELEVVPDDVYQGRTSPESQEQGSDSSRFEEEEDEDEEDHEGESDSSMFDDDDDDGGVVVPLDAMELARLRRILAMQTPNEEVDADEPCRYSATAEPSETVDAHRPKEHTIIHPLSFPPAAVARRQTVLQDDDERLPPPDQETSILHTWSQLLAQTQRLSADPDLPDHVRRLLEFAAVRDEELQQYGGTEEDLEGLSGNPPTHDYCRPESTPEEAREMLAEETEFPDVIGQPSMISTALRTTAIPPPDILKDTDRHFDRVSKSLASDVPDTLKDTDSHDNTMPKSHSSDDCEDMTMEANEHSSQNWRRSENTLVAYFSMSSQTQCREYPNTDDNLMAHATPFGEDRDSPQVPLGTVDHAMDLREEAETMLNDKSPIPRLATEQSPPAQFTCATSSPVSSKEVPVPCRDQNTCPNDSSNLPSCKSPSVNGPSFSPCSLVNKATVEAIVRLVGNSTEAKPAHADARSRDTENETLLPQSTQPQGTAFSPPSPVDDASMSYVSTLQPDSDYLSDDAGTSAFAKKGNTSGRPISALVPPVLVAPSQSGRHLSGPDKSFNPRKGHDLAKGKLFKGKRRNGASGSPLDDHGGLAEHEAGSTKLDYDASSTVEVVQVVQSAFVQKKRKARPFSASHVVPDWVPSKRLQVAAHNFVEDSMFAMVVEPANATEVPKAISIRPRVARY